MALERLQALSSTVNQKLLIQMIPSTRRAAQAPGAGTDPDQWERTLKPALLRYDGGPRPHVVQCGLACRTVKDVVLPALTPDEVVRATEAFTRYTFILLDDAAAVLQPEGTQQQNLTSQGTAGYMGLTAAEATVTASVALFLMQNVSATGGAAPLSASLEALERWHRLRRDFGIFVRPTDLADDVVAAADHQHQDVGPDGPLLRRWKTTVAADAIQKAKQRFTRFGGDYINAAIDVRVSPLAKTILIKTASHRVCVRLTRRLPRHAVGAGGFRLHR